MDTEGFNVSVLVEVTLLAAICRDSELGTILPPEWGELAVRVVIIADRKILVSVKIPRSIVGPLPDGIILVQSERSRLIELSVR